MNKYLSQPPIDYPTLVELLRSKALWQPEQRAYTFLIDGEREKSHITYAELDCQARAIAAWLQQHKAQGERALLLYATGLEFIAAFCGCLYAGVIAIPAPPPDATRLKRTLPRLQQIAKDAQATLILTTSRILPLVEDLRFCTSELLKMRCLDTEQVTNELAVAWEEPKVTREALAYLQYTSGSTSIPKGVMVSHGNLMHHCAYINKAWGYTPDSISATWMPYFHDYGLIDGLIQPLYQGIQCFVMSPIAFIKRPIRWLQAISRYRVTHSQGPNFAYEHCVRKFKLEQVSNLDLSSWRTASNGAEPIRKETLERFVETFKPYGFNENAFYPAYGLAEATLLVSTKLHTSKPILCTVQVAALRQNQIVETSLEQQNVQTLVGCGQPVGNMRVIIVHPEILIKCLPNEVGEIWVSDPSVAHGYWNRPEDTAKTFQAYLSDTGEGPFLRTGDLGFLKDGELFITGRLKDLIIIRGRNFYPQDIELTVEQSHPALRSNCGAAFSVDVIGDERLVVVQEVERHYQSLDVDQIIGAIRQAVVEHYEIEVYAVLLLKTGSIIKTSSGKIQRQACRASFLDKSLDVLEVQTLNNAAELKQQTMPIASVPVKRIDYATQTLSAPYSWQTDLSVKATDSFRGVDKNKERTDKLINWLRSYASERINSRLIDERRCIPPHILLDWGNQGILGMQTPEQYGGLNLNNCDAMRVVEQLAAIDLTLATFVCINNFLGIRPIQRYATNSVRDELLPILARGRELAAFALTEPGAGSNLKEISATAVADGKGGWLLRGTKIWSGSASWAGLINVFVQLVDENNTVSGITGFVVRQGTPGLRQGPEALTMGMRGIVQNTIYFDNTPVDSVNLLGEPGSGMASAQDAMLFTRLAIGAMSVGGMKRCTQLMLRYATRRSIATGRLIDNPVTLARVGEITAAITALETLVTQIARLLDNGCFIPMEAYIACKTFGPEFLWKAADNLVQILGGRGYIETNIAPQILRDARVFRIFEGPTETLNMFLGSRILHKSGELHQFLCNELRATSISHSLRDAVEQINARWSEESTAPFSERTTALRWASMLIGEVATYAILLAAVKLEINRTPSNRLRRAVDWLQQQFDQTLAKALIGTPISSVPIHVNETMDIISSYAETIGDIEQTLAGEDHELDELLIKQSLPKVNIDLKYNLLEETLLTNTTLESSSNISTNTANSIQDWIVDWLIREFKINSKTIDTSQPFSYYGLDSVTAVNFLDELEAWLGRTLSPNLAYDYPTIDSLTHYLTKEVSKNRKMPLVKNPGMNI